MKRSPVREPSVTFEQAQAHSWDNQLPESFILGAIAGKLKKTADSQETRGVKPFFDKVRPDASDVEFMTHNDEVIKFRDELTDFVAEEVKIPCSKGISRIPSRKAGSV